MGATSEHIYLNVKGMTCNNCAMGLSKALQSKGFEDVQVDFTAEEASFASVSEEEIENAIRTAEGLGYKARVRSGDVEEERWSPVEKKFFFSLIFTLPLFLHMFFPADAWINHPLVQIGLSLPVFGLGVWHFGRSAWFSLQSGSPNMDVLIFLGATSAFGYSLAGTFMHWGSDLVHNYLFFETSATIISLVLLGNVLEHRAGRRTTSALKNLARLKPSRAKRVITIVKFEQIEDVAYEDIEVGDILQVNTGDTIPVDGIVLSGDGATDEAMITGESLPQEKKAGERVTGGTILKTGSLRMRADQVGEETLLSQIIELVKQAQRKAPAIQQLGDRVSAIFVPVVAAIASLTFALSYFVFDLSLTFAIMNSVAVLVISCPCAMGLATPTAVAVGLGRAARNGILVKGGRTLEQLARVKTIAFDKTGTLTTGNFKLKEVRPLNGLAQEEVLSIIKGLEQHSSHPIARSLVKELKGVNPQDQLVEVKELQGLGISAQLSGQEFKLGSYRLAESQTQDDQHQLYLLRNDELIAWVDLEDELKPGVPEMLQALKKQGYKTVLISGDRKEKCETLAKDLALDAVYAEQLPDQKLEVIKTLQSEGPLAMVGDGINDAPALAQADVGISISDSTDVAMHSAQVVLLAGNDTEKLVKVMQIGRHTLVTIKQNLFWAFFYNVVAIPIAAIGLLNPMIAALAMAFSDVIVIGNSLRLRSKSIDA